MLSLGLGLDIKFCLKSFQTWLKHSTGFTEEQAVFEKNCWQQIRIRTFWETTRKKEILDLCETLFKRGESKVGQTNLCQAKQDDPHGRV